MVHEAQEPCAREYNKGNRLMFLLYDLSSVKRPALLRNVLGDKNELLFAVVYIDQSLFFFFFLFFFFTESFGYLDERIDFLMQKCVEELRSQGFEE